MKLEQLKQASRQSMARWWTRRNKIILGTIGAIAIVALLGFLLTRTVVRRGWPQTEGTLALAGLHAPVTVVRDAHGVPHIYAHNPEDLFFVQGYVHAQDRFWQMEMGRRRARGVLTQLLGETALATDAQWANLNLAEAAAHELAQMNDETRAPLEAYAAGVNAWLEMQELPFEFSLLRWRLGDIEDPAPWTAEDSLALALALAWQVGSARTDPHLAAQIEERIGSEGTTFLFTAQGQDMRFANDIPLDLLAADAEPLPRRWALGSQVTLVNGNQTESRKPLLGVDLPTGLELPAPWYVLTWHVGSDAAVGASVPGLPGLTVGVDGGAVWEKWENPQYTLLSSLKELVPTTETPPWQRWVVAALLNTGAIVEPTGEQAAHAVNEFEEKQQDTFSTRAEKLIPLLVQVEPDGWRQERVTGMLKKWDYRIGDNNKEAPFFAVYQLELARAAFADELGDDLFEAYVARSDLYQAALDRIIDDPHNPWWDDVGTAGRESREDMLKRAYEPALEWIGRNYGDLHMLWEWDIVHGSRLHHTLGDAWPWDQFLSRDLNPDGWAATTNASPGGLPCTGDICMGGDLFRAKAVYGYRQILDAADPGVLWFSLLAGQSGHPFHPHYDDLADRWLMGEYTPLRLSPTPEEVERAESVLMLIPVE